MTLVVDASVATKWILPEPGSDKAAALRSHDLDLIAPSLVVAEIGNAIWKSAWRGDFARPESPRMLQVAITHFSRLIPLEGLAANALQLSIDLKHPIYDCFYLALAERERAPLISADKRLLAASKRAKGIEIRAL